MDDDLRVAYIYFMKPPFFEFEEVSHDLGAVPVIPVIPVGEELLDVCGCFHKWG